LEKFVSLLSPDGVLILGASDLVETNIPGLELRRHQNMFYYQRREEVFTPPKDVRPSVRLPIEDKHPPKQVREKTPLPKKTASTTPAPNPPKRPTVRDEVLAMDRNGLWHEIPSFVDAYTANHGEEAFLTGMKAKALAGLGNLAAAVDLCNRSIELDKTCKYCYYIMATVLIEMGKLEEAQHAFRRAIYLDHHFFEAHFHLGQLLVRFHNYKAGLTSLRNALELAEKADPERLLFIEQELTCGQLVEILKSEIGVYEARDGKG
jgi:chemotaxis protein methyltransferase CheR